MKSAVDLGTFGFHSMALPSVFERIIFRYGLAVLSVAIALGVKLILLDLIFRIRSARLSFSRSQSHFGMQEPVPEFFLFFSRLSRLLFLSSLIRLTIE